MLLQFAEDSLRSKHLLTQTESPREFWPENGQVAKMARGGDLSSIGYAAVSCEKRKKNEGRRVNSERRELATIFELPE